jgi:hypothetical protein
MPSPRVVAGIAAALVVVGLVGLGIGAVLLVAATGSRGAGVGGALTGLGSAVGGVLLIGGLAAVLGGVFLLRRGGTARTRARTTVPGLRQSSSMLPGGALFAGLVLGVVGLRGASWVFVPAAIAGVAGAILFARSGSPDEPA